jgi:hypothetical protein
MNSIWNYLNRDPHQEDPTPLDLWVDGAVLGLLIAAAILIWALA